MSLRGILFDSLEQKIILESSSPAANEAERKRKNRVKDVLLEAIHSLRIKDNEDLDAQANAYIKAFLMISCIRNEDPEKLRETMLANFRKELDAMLDQAKAARQYAKQVNGGAQNG